MGIDDGAGDRETETGATRLARTRAVGTREPLEQLVLDRRIDAGTVVVHPQHGGVVVAGDADRHGRAGRRVRAGVGQQVGGDLVQPARVAGDEHGLIAHLEHPLVVGPGGPRIADRVDHEPRQVDRAVDELLALVEAREQQQILHERSHAQRLRLDALERRLRRLDGGGALTAAERLQRELGVAADRRERRAQLMAGVGDERAHALLVALARRERLVDVVQQRVQRLADPADLGAGVGLDVPAPARRW